jgi:hypothetical protein
VRQTRCWSLPASENVEGCQTPWKGRPSPQMLADGHGSSDTISAQDDEYLGVADSLPATPSQDPTGGSGSHDSSWDSRCSEEVHGRFRTPTVAVRPRVRPEPVRNRRSLWELLVDRLDVIPTAPVDFVEQTAPPWRHDGARSSAPRTARHRPTRRAGLELRGGRCSGADPRADLSVRGEACE